MKVHDSQAYRKMDMTRERISRILELREILLSFQTGLSLVNTAIVHAILESISGLEPSSVITEPKYLKLVTVKLLSIHFDLCVDATGVVCHQLGLLGTDLHAVGVEALSRRSNKSASSSSSPAQPSMSSAKRRLVIVLPPMLTVLHNLLRHLS